jgi:hypothetical protein
MCIGILVFRRQHLTINALLVLNCTIAGLITNVTDSSQAVYQLANNGADALCIFRGYMLYTSSGLLFHSLVLQAIYRLFVNIFASRRFFQSTNVILLMLSFQWLFSWTFCLPIVIPERISYDVDNAICQVGRNGNPDSMLVLK